MSCISSYNNFQTSNNLSNFLIELISFILECLLNCFETFLYIILKSILSFLYLILIILEITFKIISFFSSLKSKSINPFINTFKTEITFLCLNSSNKLFISSSGSPFISFKKYS